jgi:small-conductance mechanosensitive channel
MERPQFEPISQRSPAVIVGALVWVLAIVVVLWVIGHRNAVEIAFAVTFGSIFMWAFLLAAGRVRRERREREP